MILVQSILMMALAQDPNEAQVLHGEMCEILLNAETVQLDYKAEAKVKGSVVKTQVGKILLQMPESLYISIESKDPKKPETVVSISDGTQFKVGDKPAKAATAGAVKNYKGIVALMGLSTYFNNKSVRATGPKMKDFSFGKKEGDSQPVSYSLDFGNPDLIVTTTVWIDVKTKLPLKRTTHLKAGADEADFIDAYTGLKAGEKIDPKWFVVPK
jgi:hypothetical protein